MPKTSGTRTRINPKMSGTLVLFRGKVELLS